MVANDTEETAQRKALVERSLVAIEALFTERCRTHPPPADTAFSRRYEHLVVEITALLDAVPELELEAIGRSGLRVSFSGDEREVRITSLEDQGLVHFVFGHKALGRRAEHHASPPFGEHPPDLLKLTRQLVRFLLTGAEPRWLSHRSAADSTEPHASRTDPSVLELPLE